MAKSSDEMSHWPEYAYVIVNDDLQRAYKDVLAIIQAERLKVARVEKGIEAFVDGLIRA